MKIMTQWIGPCAGAFVAASLFAGCSSTSVNTVERAQPTAQRQMLDDKRVLQDISLSRAVRIVALNEDTGPGGFVKIQVEVRNTTSSPKSFNYRVEWFDGSGMLITSPPAQAIARTIEGKETMFLSATAPVATAKDFRIKFMESVR
jgi:uncharacterized protein YcfL